MRRKLSILAALTAAIAMAAPVSAITNGVADEGEHPYRRTALLFYVPDVESSFFEDPGGWFSCSGTLVSPNRDRDRGALHVRHRRERRLDHQWW